jgi:hypothetical protein
MSARRPVIAVAALAVLAGTFVLGTAASAVVAKAVSPAATPVKATGRSRAAALVGFEGTVYRMKGFTGVTNASPGIWCLALPKSIDAKTVVPTVSPEFSHSPNYDVGVQWASNAASCPGNQLQVFTFNGPPAPGSFANEAFSIVVP